MSIFNDLLKNIPTAPDDVVNLAKKVGIDRDKDGNPLDDLAGMAKGLFGKS